MAVRSAARVALLVLTFTSSLFAQGLADDQSRRQALDLYRKGQEYMTAERFELAAESYTAAIDKDPLLSVAHYQLGQAYMNLKRYGSAIQAYKGCMNALARLHALEESSKFQVDKMREEEIRELRVEINQVKAVSPLKREVLEQRLHALESQRADYRADFHPPAFVLLALGSAYFRNGELAPAEEQWEAAVTADSKYGEAHNNLAVVYMMTKRKKEAEEAIKAAEKSGFRVNPQLKEDIKTMVENPKTQTPNPKPQS
jgi:Tfp pilus assembly protein PilF